MLRRVFPMILFAIAFAAVGILNLSVDAQDTEAPTAAAVSSVSRDHDGDGIPNGKDDDFARPRDGSCAGSQGEAVVPNQKSRCQGGKCIANGKQNTRGAGCRQQISEQGCSGKQATKGRKGRRWGRGRRGGKHAMGRRGKAQNRCCQKQTVNQGQGHRRGQRAMNQGDSGCGKKACGNAVAGQEKPQGACAVGQVDVTPADQPLDSPTRQALIEAMQDEYRARASYEAVIKKFGEVMPFANIIHAESRHIEALKPLFARYDVPVPEDIHAGKIDAPDTLQEAYKAGVEAEIANAGMYDRFFEFVSEPDIVLVFQRLRDASQLRHLRAFQRWAARE